jgi:hypothetical protein
MENTGKSKRTFVGECLFRHRKQNRYARRSHRVIGSNCLSCNFATSNASYMAVEVAIGAVKQTGDLPPLHLRNAPKADETVGLW